MEAVAGPQLATPDARVQVLAAHDRPAAAGERHEQPELADRQRHRPAAREEQALGGVDLQRADADDVVMLRDRRVHRAAQDRRACARARLPGCEPPVKDL